MAVTPAPSPRAARTRARLYAEAMRLFAEHGYAGTTVGTISRAAGVSEMTFFRHFGSKESLLLDDPYDPLIVAGVAEQPRELPPLLRAVRGVRAAWAAVPLEADVPIRERIRVVAAAPELQGAVHANTRRTQEAVAAQLVADGTAPHDAAVAAAAVLAAVMTSLLLWAQADPEGDGAAGPSLSAAILAALDVLEVSDVRAP